MMKIADVVLKIAIEAEIKNPLGEKEVFGKGDASSAYQIVAEAMRDMYPEAQPRGEENRQ